MTLLAILLVGLLGAPQQAFAEPPPARAGDVPPGLRGPLQVATFQEAIQRAARQGHLSLAQTRSPEAGWASRHPVVFGTLIGAGIGAGMTVVGCAMAGNEPAIVSCYNWLPILTGVGAGAGAIVGWARSR
jgi:hypothetical protein